MKILVAGARYYDGNPNMGASYEYSQIAGTLLDLGLQVGYLDTQQPNADMRLERAAKAVDLVFVIPMERELNWSRLPDLHKPIVLLLPDDEWRRDFGLFLAPYVDFILSTARDAVHVYGDKAVPFQWGARVNLYRPEPPTIPISFFGAKYGYREQVIRFVEQLGIPIKAYGKGWSEMITDEGIATLLCRSKISLTTSLNSTGTVRQIKARNFEIAASGALLMAEYAAGLEDIYREDKEAIFWKEPGELGDKLYFFLTHNDERQCIAQAGRKRTVEQYDMRKRFVPLLVKLGVLSVQR